MGVVRKGLLIGEAEPVELLEDVISVDEVVGRRPKEQNSNALSSEKKGLRCR